MFTYGLEIPPLIINSIIAKRDTPPHDKNKVWYMIKQVFLRNGLRHQKHIDLKKKDTSTCISDNVLLGSEYASDNSVFIAKSRHDI